VFKGFKQFITQGNVIDLAVAVVIGAAFGAIITAFVDAIINPIIGALVPSGDLAGWTIDFPGIFDEVHLGIGAIIAAAINFVLIALVIYLALVVPMNRYKDRQAAKAAPVEEAPAGPTTEELLAEIRDLLAKQQSSSD